MKFKKDVDVTELCLQLRSCIAQFIPQWIFEMNEV
jgi:hypothetical protein